MSLHAEDAESAEMIGILYISITAYSCAQLAVKAKKTGTVYSPGFFSKKIDQNDLAGIPSGLVAEKYISLSIWLLATSSR